MAEPRESVPFRYGKSVPADVIYALLGDSDESERRDDPAPVDRPSSGRRWHLRPLPNETSRMQQLEQVAASESLWDLIEKSENRHDNCEPPRRTGGGRGYCPMDVALAEAGSHLFGGVAEAVRSFRSPDTWQRLRPAAEEAFANSEDRRLSKKALSRQQVHRARRGRKGSAGDLDG